MDKSITRGLNLVTTVGLLTATGAVTTYDTTVTIVYAINGKAATKVAVALGATPTTDYVTGLAFPALIGGGSVANVPGNGCIVVWGLVSGGTVKCVMGPASPLDIQGNFRYNASQFPTVPDDMVPFAYQVLKAGATASASGVVFGTALWNAAGFTNVIQNVFALPERPQVA